MCKNSPLLECNGCGYDIRIRCEWTLRQYVGLFLASLCDSAYLLLGSNYFQIGNVLEPNDAELLEVECKLVKKILVLHLFHCCNAMQTNSLSDEAPFMINAVLNIL